MTTRSAKKPKKTCNDPNCPFHGTLSIRGHTLEGVVISAKMDKTIVVRRDYLNYCLLYTSPSPRDATLSRMPSSA